MSSYTRPVLAVGLAMVVTGCGSATAHLHSTEATSSTQSTVTSTEVLTDDADQLTGVTSTAQLQNYLKALEPVRREIAKANIASHTMVRLTKIGRLRLRRKSGRSAVGARGPRENPGPPRHRAPAAYRCAPLTGLCLRGWLPHERAAGG